MRAALNMAGWAHEIQDTISQFGVGVFCVWGDLTKPCKVVKAGVWISLIWPFCSRELLPCVGKHFLKRFFYLLFFKFHFHLFDPLLPSSGKHATHNLFFFLTNLFLWLLQMFNLIPTLKMESLRWDWEDPGLSSSEVLRVVLFPLFPFIVIVWLYWTS